MATCCCFSRVVRSIQGLQYGNVLLQPCRSPAAALTLAQLLSNRQVHSWGGCPTWQLSHFCLGLAPRFDIGPRHFTLALHVGTMLLGASGTVPARDGAAIDVSWKRDAAQIHLTLTVDSTTHVLGWPKDMKTWVELGAGKHIATFAAKDCI